MVFTPPTAYVILAAGKGSRLGGAMPKPLTRLADGRTILQQQLDNLTEAFGLRALAATSVVVGHRSEELLEALPPAVRSIHNPAYDTSNTAKSLLMALQRIVPGQGVLWLNGDVVFSPAVLRRLAPFMAEELSAMAVVEGRVGEEEIKYTLDEAGYLAQVSKTVTGGLGEAVGINYVGPTAVSALRQALAASAPQDYFEAAIEALIRKGHLWAPAFATDLRAVEVDFAEDLQRANAELLESLKGAAGGQGMGAL